MSNRNSRKSGKNRRPQISKENKPLMRGMLELRQGSRTTPVPSGKVYKRKAKHGNKEW